MRNALDRSFRDRHLMSPQIHIYEQATNFVFTRVLFWSFFFPKPCLKIRGAAYVRVFMVDGEPIAELALPVGLVGTFVTSKSLIEWITRFLVWKKKHINLVDCLCFSKMFMFKKDVFRLVKSMGQRKKFWVPMRNRTWDTPLDTEPQRLYGERGLLRSSYDTLPAYCYILFMFIVHCICSSLSCRL